MICEKIRGAAIPCVDLGGSELGFETVSIPQDEAFYALTTHVIERHHCRNLLLAATAGFGAADAGISAGG